ncbi:DUF5312 family protein [Spirochaetia bacterium 38H-sp]|uniref:DUF5312 family protein n=1 Tax=Rarispira pelagica TaxID=3141764 RepID=A0ABU9UAM6_9SPIR
MDVPVLNMLARELSEQEREELRKKLMEESEKDAGFNIGATQEELHLEEQNIEEVWEKLSILTKLIIFLKSLFGIKKREDAIKQIILGRIRTRINKNNSLLLNYKEKRFTPLLYDNIKTIADIISAIRKKMLPVYTNKNADAFIALLTGFFIPEAQSHLESSGDIYKKEEKIRTESPSLNFQDIKKTIKKELSSAIDESFSYIPPKARVNMQDCTGFFYYTKALIDFSFPPLLSFWGHAGANQTIMWDNKELQLLLVELVNILYSTEKVPPLSYFRILATFIHNLEIGKNPEIKGHNEIYAELVGLFSELQEKAHELPLLEIVRYITENPSYMPSIHFGGEDWLARTKRYWREKFDTDFKDFVAYKEKEDLYQRMCEITGVKTLLDIKNYSNATGQDYTGKHALSLMFLKTFGETIFFPKHVPTLKTIVLDGNFYKQDNKNKFTESYNILMGIKETIEQLEARFSDNGELGRIYNAITREIAMPVLKRKRLEVLFEQEEKKIEQWLVSVQNAASTMGKVLGGILWGKSGEAYDTLSNLDDLDIKNHRLFKPNLAETQRTIAIMAGYLKESLEIENKQ